MVLWQISSAWLVPKVERSCAEVNTFSIYTIDPYLQICIDMPHMFTYELLFILII